MRSEHLLNFLYIGVFICCLLTFNASNIKVLRDARGKRECTICEIEQPGYDLLNFDINLNLFKALEKHEVAKAIASVMSNKSADDQTLVKAVYQYLIDRPWPRWAISLRKHDENPYFAGTHHDHVLDIIFKGKRNGFFIEVGAYDGQSASNSLFFELSRNWTGLLIEPDPLNYKYLQAKRRHSYAANTCLGIDNRTYTVGFSFNQEMWGSINENATTTVGCFPLYTFLKALGRDYVDIFALDIEGLDTEIKVLETIPWNSVSFGAINIEVYQSSDKDREKLGRFMNEKGFVKAIIGGFDIIYLNKNLAGNMPTQNVSTFLGLP